MSETEHGALRGQSSQLPVLPGFSRRVEAKHGCAQELVQAQAQHPGKHLHAAPCLQWGQCQAGRFVRAYETQAGREGSCDSATSLMAEGTRHRWAAGETEVLDACPLQGMQGSRWSPDVETDASEWGPLGGVLVEGIHVPFCA